MCFWLKILRVRGSWNTHVNVCIMTITVFLEVIIEKVLALKRLITCSFVQAKSHKCAFD